jgi:hypothetical protein
MNTEAENCTEARLTMNDAKDYESENSRETSSTSSLWTRDFLENVRESGQMESCHAEWRMPDAAEVRYECCWMPQKCHGEACRVSMPLTQDEGELFVFGRGVQTVSKGRSELSWR